MSEVAMSRSPNSERIFAAQKAGTIERLVGGGVPRDRAIAWVESWEGGAADIHRLRRDPFFWDNRYRYARAEFDAGHKPPKPDVSSDERDPRL
jgi:hypothetical protein